MRVFVCPDRRGCIGLPWRCRAAAIGGPIRVDSAATRMTIQRSAFCFGFWLFRTRIFKSQHSPSNYLEPSSAPPPCVTPTAPSPPQPPPPQQQHRPASTTFHPVTGAGWCSRPFDKSEIVARVDRALGSPAPSNTEHVISAVVCQRRFAAKVRPRVACSHGSSRASSFSCASMRSSCGRTR